MNGICTKTARTYLRTDKKKLQDKLKARLEERVLDKYSNLIYKMFRDGFNISAIDMYLRHIDENVDLDKIKEVIIRICERYFNHSPVNQKTLKRKTLKQACRITRNEILKYIVTIHKKKSKKVRRHWPLLKKEYSILQGLEKFYRYFHNCLKEKTATLIDKYIDEYKDSAIFPKKQFIKGISKDLTAIKEGIKTGISSGFVEGGNNKIKLIKRLAYGRMKFPRLRQKILTVAKFF